jgi:two-component system response regulator (stage 0 sporulation protein A)
MCQPCNIHAALSYIIDFQDKLLGASDPIQSSARSLLIDLGFRTNLCGYRYLISALCILQENPNQSLTKELYPAVAKLHNGSWQQIEHGIRLSIANAWENRSGDAWKRYFADDRVKPTNSVFLTRLAQCLQRQEK